MDPGRIAGLPLPAGPRSFPSDDYDKLVTDKRRGLRFRKHQRPGMGAGLASCGPLHTGTHHVRAKRASITCPPANSNRGHAPAEGYYRAADHVWRGSRSLQVSPSCFRIEQASVYPGRITDSPK